MTIAELDLNRDTVQHIIDLAHEFHARDDVVFEEDVPVADEFWARQMSADFAEDIYYQELKNSINDLEPDQQVTLVALMWTGRGDFDIAEWQEALDAAGEAWNERTADYLIGTPMLADYLTEGLDLHDYSHENTHD